MMIMTNAQKRQIITIVMKSSPKQYNGWLVDLWIVNDGCDDKVDADDQHNDRDDDRALERYFMMTMDLVMMMMMILVTVTLYGRGSFGSLYRRTRSAAIAPP